LAQLAKHKLALQFERDEEEEEGHQSVVDPRSRQVLDQRARQSAGYVVRLSIVSHT
jgi:hypothetical protein